MPLKRDFKISSLIVPMSLPSSSVISISVPQLRIFWRAAPTILPSLFFMMKDLDRAKIFSEMDPYVVLASAILNV